MLWEDKENRKGAVKPRPLCTPLGLFLRVPGCGDVWPCWLVFVFFGVGCVTLCRCEVECFDCGKCVFIDFCLYSSVLNMGRCADCCSVAATGVYKVLFATFRLSVELPVQKHTGTG